MHSKNLLKLICILSFFFAAATGLAAPKPLPSLPLWTAAGTNSSDTTIFVNTAQQNLAHRLYLWDLINLPPFAAPSFVTGKPLTGLSPAAGTVTASDSVLSAFNKILGNLDAIEEASVTVGTLDSETASTNGAVIDNNELVLQSASGTRPGLVNTTTQTFAGAKTFSGGVVGNVTGTASGNELPLTFSAPLARSTNTVSIPAGTGSVNGYLPSAKYGEWQGTTDDVAAATDAATADELVRRDGSGDASFNEVTADTFNGDLAGNADTATAFAANPSDCASNAYATAIGANGNLTCSAVSDSGLSVSYIKADGTRALTGNWNAGAFNITASTFIGALTGNASTASAFDHNPSACPGGEYATDIAADGTLTCAAVTPVTPANFSVGTGLTISAGTGTGATLQALTVGIASGYYLPSTSDQTTWNAKLGTSAIGSTVQAWDADLDNLAAKTGTNTIYYRSGAGTWSPVTVGTGLDFTGGSLTFAGSSSALTKAYAITGHGFVVGDLLKCASTSVCTKSKADTEAGAEITGIVSAVADANNFTLTLEGYVTGLSGLTADSTYFISDATAGLLSLTQPSTTDYISRPVFRSDSTSSGVFHPLRGWKITSSSGGGGSSATTITMGGRTFEIAYSDFGDTAGKYKLLRGASHDGTTFHSYFGLGDQASMVSANGYQVPTGLTLRLLAYRTTNAVSGMSLCQWAYGDTAGKIYSNNTPMTNPVYQGGGINQPYILSPGPGGAIAEGITDFTIPAGKYVGGYCYNGGQSYEVIGILE